MTNGSKRGIGVLLLAAASTGCLGYFDRGWKVEPGEGAAAADAPMVSRWNGEVEAIRREIRGAGDSARLSPLVARIDALEKEFAPRRAFLDAVLHPVTFESSVAALRSDLDAWEDRFRSDEETSARIEKAGAQLAAADDRIRQLSSQLDSAVSDRRVLAAEIEKMKTRTERRKKLSRALRVPAQPSSSAGSAAEAPAR